MESKRITDFDEMTKYGWAVGVCSQEKASIILVDNYETLVGCIVQEGLLAKKLAEYIVDMHNKRFREGGFW